MSDKSPQDDKTTSPGGPVATLIGKGKNAAGSGGGLSATVREFRPNPQAQNQPPPQPVFVVGQQQAFLVLWNSLGATGANLKMVDTTRSGPLVARLQQLVGGLQGFSQTRFTDDTAGPLFWTPLAGWQGAAVMLHNDISYAIQKGPKVLPQVGCGSLPPEVVVGTILTLDSIGAWSIPAAPLCLGIGGQPLHFIKVTQPGKLIFDLVCFEGDDHVHSVLPLSVMVRLPQRPIPIGSIAEIEYGTQVTAAMLGLTGQLAAGLIFQPANGMVEVSAGNNLLIIAPAVPGQYVENRIAIHVPVRPKTRTLNARKPNRRLETGEQLELDWFSAQPDFGVGVGDISFVQPAGGQFLTCGKNLQVVLTIGASGNFASATSATILVDVEKGTPTITWVPPPVAVVGTLVDASLNAVISPPHLRALLTYTPKAGTTWAAPRPQYIHVAFPGNDHFLPAKAEEKQMVVTSAATAQGANAMLTGAAWQKGTEGPDRTAIVAGLVDWNADRDGVKTLGKQIVKDVAKKTQSEVIAYLNTLPDATTGNDTWSFANGLQIRVKPAGDNFTYACAVNVEFVKQRGNPTQHPHDACFKVMPNGEPGGRDPGDVLRPDGMSDTDWEDYKQGAMRMTHMVCPKVTQVLTWAMRAGQALTRGQARPELMTVSCLGGATLQYWIDRNAKSTTDFVNFNFPRPGNDIRLRVKANATDRYMETELTLIVVVS